jgi:Flp pilus assembly protein TadD
MTGGAAEGWKLPAIIAFAMLQRRAFRWPAVALLAPLLGCSQYQRFDSVSHLRAQYAANVGAARAAELVVPFEPNETIRSQADLFRGQPSDLRRLNRVLEFIFQELDLRYALNPTRSAVDTLSSQRGNCLSFVNLFVSMAREVGLNPFYVEVTDYQKWSHRAGMVVSQGHIVAGMYLDGELKTYDFLPWRPKAYKEFEPIDDLAAAAHFYNNLGAEALLAGDLERARQLLETAAAIDVRTAKPLNNLGVALARAGDRAGALTAYAKALEVAPDDSMVMTNLARLYQLGGDEDAADELLARVEASNTSNPFFYLYQSDVALARGNQQAALDYATRALRLDTESPEVHVGLVKIYLALGEMDKAEHHLGRALKLDATNEEARRYAAMLGR